jgi:hypothetical protein
VFHHEHEDGRETYLVARASPYWPHCHTDPGSFFLYYRNAPLVTEAGRGCNASHALVKSQASGHNTLRFDDKDPFQYDWPHRQNLVKFVSQPGLEYAVLDCRQDKLVLSTRKRRGHGDAETLDVDIRHFRHIAYLKPDIFIVYDAVLNAPFASDYRLHVYAESVRFEGNHAFFTGRHGVDLDVAVVLPERPAFGTTEVIDTHSVEFANAPGRPYLVVLSPRESGKMPLVECSFQDDTLAIAVGSLRHRVRLVPSEVEGVYDMRLS